MFKKVYFLFTLLFTLFNIGIIENNNVVKTQNYKRSNVTYRQSQPQSPIHIDSVSSIFKGTLGVDNMVLYIGDTWYFAPKDKFDAHLYGFVFDNYDIDVTMDASFASKNGLDVSLANQKFTIFKVDDNYTSDDILFYQPNAVIPIFELKNRDSQVPTINGTTNFIVNVNKMLTIDEIKSHIKAFDETDGQLTVQNEPTNYNPNNKVTGDYTMVVFAVDKAGNRSECTINIKVVDIDKPTISGTNSYVRSYDDPITLDEIKSKLTISDNYDKNLTLEVVKDDYASTKNTIGVKTISFKTTDSSQNVSDIFNVTITVEDKKAPVISAPGVINIGTSNTITLNDIKSKITINDGYDGNITVLDNMITGFDAYLANPKLQQDYQLSVNVSDKQGNTQTATITLKVKDTIAPQITFDSYFIILGQGESLTKEQIKEYAAKVLNINSAEILSVEGEYNPNKAGEYNVNVKLKNGEKRSFNIIVNELLEYRNLEWYEYIYIWFTVLFNIETKYQTNSFWNFASRCKFITEIYNTGKILI